MAAGSNNESIKHFSNFLIETGFQRDTSKGSRRLTFYNEKNELCQFSFTTKGNIPQSRQFYEDVKCLYSKMEETGDVLFSGVTITPEMTPTRVIPKCGTKGYNVKIHKSAMTILDISKIKRKI